MTIPSQDKRSFLDEMLSIFSDETSIHERVRLTKKLEGAIVHTLTVNNSFKLLTYDEELSKASLAATYFQNGDFHSALHVFQDLLINQPHNATWWVYIAGCYIAMTEHHKAHNAASIAYILLPDDREIQELYSLTKEYVESINQNNINITSAQ